MSYKYEGYLFLDQRSVGQGVTEAATFTCSHCQAVVIMNPDRKRTRYHCRGCDHLLCDNCAAARVAGANCKTYKQKIDEYLESVERQAGASPLILLS
jgi:hypothetical protein